MKNFKLAKYLFLLPLFFTFNSNASVLDKNSFVNANLPDKVGWDSSSHLWRVKDSSLSVYSPDAISIVDGIISSDRSTHRLTINTSPYKLTTSLLVDIVVQLSIDVFVQYSAGMTDYKNLLTGIDATVIGDLKSGVNQTDLAHNVAINNQDTSVVPVPHAIWLFVTGFMTIVWYRKKT
jgi:hypothetical protein